MNKLLACPKCHKESECCDVGNWLNYIRCMCCGLEGSLFRTKELATEDWNTRATDPRVMELAYKIGHIRDNQSVHPETIKLLNDILMAVENTFPELVVEEKWIKPN